MDDRVDQGPVDVSGLLSAWRRGDVPEFEAILQDVGIAARFRFNCELYNEREFEAIIARIPEGFVHDMRPVGTPGKSVLQVPSRMAMALAKRTKITALSSASPNWLVRFAFIAIAATAGSPRYQRERQAP